MVGAAERTVGLVCFLLPGSGDPRHMTQGDCIKLQREEQSVGKSQSSQGTRTSLLSLSISPIVFIGLSPRAC